jgi:hypothetical protein
VKALRGGALAAALLAAGAAGSAAASCAPAGALAEMLAGEWGEARRFSGLDARGAVIELWVAPSGSWTLLVVSPGGTACLAASGSAGAVLPAPPARPAGEPG